MAAGKREPELYNWIGTLPSHAVFFDIGTNYGQESVWASSLKGRNITVVGFDCGLLGAHFCALNSVLNENRFSFVFAAVGAKSGDLIDISINSDTHIRGLHKKMYLILIKSQAFLLMTLYHNGNLNRRT